MGRTKRFSILNAAIKKYGATGGTAITQYKGFKAGTIVQTFTGTAQGTRELRALLPFGLDSTAPKLIVQISGRAIAPASITAIGVTEANLNLSAVDGSAGTDSGFVPAKAIIKTGSTATGTPKTSTITTKSYKNHGGNSVTLPFGQGTAADANNLLAMQSKIAVAVAAGAARRSVTFTPERFYQ